MWRPASSPTPFLIHFLYSSPRNSLHFLYIGTCPFYLIVCYFTIQENGMLELPLDLNCASVIANEAQHLLFLGHRRELVAKGLSASVNHTC